MIDGVQELDVVALLQHLARQQTSVETLFSDKLPVRSMDARLADRRRKRDANDAAVLKARGLLASMGVAL